MNQRLKDVLLTSLFFLIVVIFSFLLVKFVAQRTEVVGNSMNPTLSDGDNLILYKLGYNIHDPERYDIIVFPFRDGSGKNYIKRIIGLPGETIRIDEDGFIYINDELLDESYGKEIIKMAGSAAEGVTLGEDEYFVLGDNRNDSEDSRFSVGKVKRSEIIGKAWLRIWPFSEIGNVSKKR